MKRKNTKPCESIKLIMEAIDESGKSFVWIAEKAEVTIQTLYNWQNGTVYYPQHRTLVRVARALGLSWRLIRAN